MKIKDMQNISIEELMTFINHRQSVGHLVEPAPSMTQIHQVVASALTAPDHHRLHPWRFIVIEHAQREAFGELLSSSMAADGETDSVLLERIKLHPLRAPLLLICIMQYHPHPKVPEYEQVLSCGAAIQNILLSLQAQGFASMWRSGAVAESPSLKRSLGCSAQDVIAGLIYIGTADKSIAPRQQLNVTDFLTTWKA